MPEQPQQNGAIVLLSGGLDSTVALADTLTRQPVLLALTFDYGQRAVERELAATRAIAAHYAVPHQVIALPWLSALLPPVMQAGSQQAWPVEPNRPYDLNKVWVPNRNGLFLNIAACFAEAMQAKAVVFGANAEEGAEFPDNSPAFRDRMNDTMAYSTRSGVRVETPMGRLSKTEIIQRGLDLDVPFGLIWSCYEGADAQCGHCPSCMRVKNAQERLVQMGGALAGIRFRSG